MRDIRDITSDAVEALRPLLEEAFAAGKAEGRRESADEFKAKIGAILGDESTPPPPSDRRSATIAADEEARVPSGTVKPEVMRLIRDTPQGITTQQITALTGFKHNSVRGTLWGLQKEGKIARRGDRWFAQQQMPESDHPPYSGGHNSSNGEDDDETRFSLGV